MGLLSAATSAVGDLAGTIYSAHVSNRQQQKAQEFAKWQMRNAHQEEVKDLQAAGLNPVLSAGGSGANAGVSGHTSTHESSLGSDTVNAGIQSAVAGAQVSNIKADTKLKQAMATTENTKQNNINADTNLKSQQKQLSGAQTIETNIKNMINAKYGTSADSGWIERVAGIAKTALFNNPVMGLQKAVDYAVKRVKNK